MLIVYASCVVKEDSLGEFLKVAKELVKCSKEEKENVSYNLVKDVDETLSYAFVEKWPDEEALAKHMKTEHFTNCIAKISTLIEGELAIKKLYCIA